MSKTLKEVIVALSKNPNANMIWVGKNYSKADLIKDLEEISKHYQEISTTNNILDYIEEDHY